MKLSKALKEKSRLVGEINRLKSLIARENSRNIKSKSTVDVADLFIKLDSAIYQLINIKTAIFKANTGIYEKIAIMGELKTKIEWIQSLNTKNDKEEIPYTNGMVTVEYTAYRTQEWVDSEVAQLQKQIGDIQDEIDEYNATTSIDI